METSSIEKINSKVSEIEGHALWVGWCERASELQILLNDSTRFLAAFDVRKAQGVVTGLLEYADECKIKVLPRKKFSFSKRPSGSVAEAAAVASAKAAAAATPGGSSSWQQQVVGAVRGEEERCVSPHCDAPGGAGGVQEDEYTLEDLMDTVVFVGRGEVSERSEEEVRRLDLEIGEAEKRGEDAGIFKEARRKALVLTGGRDLRLLRCKGCIFVLLDKLKVSV